MSVVGFDLSSNNICAAFIPTDNITYNDVNKSGTPAAVCFDGKQRIVGSVAARNENSFCDIMKVIGKTKSDLISDPQVSCLLEKGPDALLFCVPDIHPEIRFTATHLLAMVLSELKAMAERALRVDNVEECCIGIPAYFSKSQRLAVCQAAKIAGFSKVSLAASITATVLGHSIIHGKAVQQGKTVEKILAIVDIDSNNKQVAIVSLKRQELDVLSHILDSGTADLKVLLQRALTQAGVETQNIKSVLVTGSGANFSVIEESIKGFFPKQEQKGAAKTSVVSATDLVAKGCAILCAIRSEGFKTRQYPHKLNSMKDFLVNFKVTEKWPPVDDKITELPVDDGRVQLTDEELNVACKYESKVALREKFRVIISNIPKLSEYATEKEITEWENAKKQLDNDDLDKLYTHVKRVENTILDRKDEHKHKDAMGGKLLKKIKEYESYLESTKPEYTTIRKTAKGSLKQNCAEQREWLKKQNKILSSLSKQEGPTSFIANTMERIEYLEQVWQAAKLEREPKIVKLTYKITEDTFCTTIDDFREQLLKGVEEKTILGCRVLPFQTEINGVPCIWFQVTLIGRDDESTVLHVKNHNGYIMGFNNKEGQPYEMGPGNQNNNEGQQDGNVDTDPGLLRFTIVGAKYAGFKCDYVSVINPLKLWTKEVVMRKFEEFKLGEVPWLDSIHVLYYNGCEPKHHEDCPLCKAPHAVQRAFMCISVMLNECTRMDGVKKAVRKGFSGMTLFELLVRYMWLWKVMSFFLRRWDADNKAEVPADVLKHAKASTALEVAAIMFLVLNACAPGKLTSTKDKGSSSQTSASSGGDNGDEKEKGNKQSGPSPASEPGLDGAKEVQSQPQVGLGQNLLQIFSVTTKGINLSDIRAILVHEENCRHLIYSYGGESASAFKLSGPDMAINSEAGCILEVVPKTGNMYGASEGTLLRLDDGCSHYDRPMLKHMYFGDGKLFISYAILTGAVEGNLKIKLQLPSTGITPNVSGCSVCDPAEWEQHFICSPRRECSGAQAMGLPYKTSVGAA